MVEVSNTKQVDITEQWCPWKEDGAIQEQSGSLGDDNNSNLPANDVYPARPLPSPLPDCLGHYGSLPDYQGSALFNKSCGFAGDFYLLQDLSSTEEQGNDGSTENVFFGENDDDGVVIDDDDGDKDKDNDNDANDTSCDHEVEIKSEVGFDFGVIDARSTVTETFCDKDKDSGKESQDHDKESHVGDHK